MFIPSTGTSNAAAPRGGMESKTASIFDVPGGHCGEAEAVIGVVRD